MRRYYPDRVLSFFEINGSCLENWGFGFIFFHFFRYKTPQLFGNLFLDPR